MSASTARSSLVMNSQLAGYELVVRRSGRIISSGVPGIATANPPNSLERSPNRAVFPDRLDHVRTACRLEAADVRQKRTDDFFIKQNQSDQNKSRNATHGKISENDSDTITKAMRRIKADRDQMFSSSIEIRRRGQGEKNSDRKTNDRTNMPKYPGGNRLHRIKPTRVPQK